MRISGEGSGRSEERGEEESGEELHAGRRSRSESSS
jgi:hypothetical protein